MVAGTVQVTRYASGQIFVQYRGEKMGDPKLFFIYLHEWVRERFPDEPYSIGTMLLTMDQLGTSTYVHFQREEEAMIFKLGFSL